MILEHVFETYILFFFCLTFLFFSIGYGLEKLLGIKINGTFQLLFFRLLIGCLFLLSSGAIYYSKGITVMLSILIMGVYGYGLHFKYSKKLFYISPKSISWNALLISVVGFFIIYCVQYFSLFHANSNVPIADLDTAYYSNLSNYLSIFGTENLSLDFLQIDIRGCEPYHFGDIWINTIAKDLFRLNACLTLKLIVYPVLTLIILIGYCALIEKAGLKGWLPYIFAIAFLNFGGLYFSFFEHFKYLTETNIFSFNPINYPKLAFVYMLLQAALIVYLNGYRLIGLVLFALLPVFFITVFPAVAITIFLIAFKTWYSQRNIENAIMDFLPLVVISFFLFFFFYFQPEGVSVNSGQFNETISTLLSLHYFVTCFNIMGLTIIQCGIVFFPLIILILLSIPLKDVWINIVKNELVFFATVFFLSSLFSWSLFHNVTQTVQLFFNGAVPLIEVAAFSIALYCWKSVAPLKRKVLMAIMVFTLISNTFYCYLVMKRENVYSDRYLIDVSNKLRKSFSNGAFLLAPNEYSNMFARSSSYYILGVHMTYYFPIYYSYSLSVFDMPINDQYTESELKYLQNSVFYKYIEEQKKQHSFKSISQSQLDFMVKFKINHIFISKGAIVDSLMQSKISVLITDENTGEKFYRFNY